MKRPLLLSFALFLCAAPTFSRAQGHPAEAPPPIHNGIWWQSKSKLFQDAFTTGYKSGSTHASGHPIEITQYPVSELVDGVNHFYKDFRNRNILVDEALIYVIDQLRGIPDDQLNAELLKMRAAAAPSPVE
jgi:hypothetical protein